MCDDKHDVTEDDFDTPEVVEDDDESDPLWDQTSEDLEEMYPETS